MKRNIALTTLGVFTLIAIGLATVGVFGTLTPQPASAQDCDMNKFVRSHLVAFRSSYADGKVNLTWGGLNDSTCTRQDGHQVVVERRAEGQPEWEIIGRLQAFGFVDTSPPNATFVEYRIHAMRGGLDSRHSHLRHTTHDSVLIPVDIPNVVVPDVVVPPEDAMFCTFRVDGVIRMEWLPYCDMVVVK